MKINSKIASDIISFFKDKPVEKAYIFGSFARDEANERSDLDILLELDYSQSIGWDFYGWHDELEALLNMKVDLVTENSLSKHIKPYVDKDKQLIYAKQAE